jgi:hypothetical protein
MLTYAASAAVVFDPAPCERTPQTHYTLVGLLSYLSPAFKRNWSRLMQVVP